MTRRSMTWSAWTAYRKVFSRGEGWVNPRYGRTEGGGEAEAVSKQWNILFDGVAGSALRPERKGEIARERGKGKTMGRRDGR